MSPLEHPLHLSRSERQSTELRVERRCKVNVVTQKPKTQAELYPLEPHDKEQVSPSPLQSQAPRPSEDEKDPEGTRCQSTNAGNAVPSTSKSYHQVAMELVRLSKILEEAWGSHGLSQNGVPHLCVSGSKGRPLEPDSGRGEPRSQ